MLPALSGDTPTLGDVLTSASGALVATENRLDLPPVRSAIVVLVDGLGVSALREREGHARRLLSGVSMSDGVIHAPFPTTTVAALATLTTGRSAGEHGLVGYRVIDPTHDRVVAVLRDWDERMVPDEWQPCETEFQRAARRGIEPIVVAPERYRRTGFTEAVLRGAQFIAERTMTNRLARAVRLATSGPSRLIYVYIPELDKAGHGYGSLSPQWLERLDELDAALRALETGLPADVGALLTADHGMIDVPSHRRRVIPADSLLWSGVRHVAGEPRCLQLAVDQIDNLETVANRWREAESDRAWILTRDQAIAEGWFGVVDARHRERIGDLLVAARSAVAYYDERTASPQALAMVGQHGSFAPEETRIPLARFGAFAP